MKRVFFGIFMFIIFVTGYEARAHHPNEGSLSLDGLIQEALANNLDIKESEAQLQSAVAREKSTLGAFAPEVSLEGGPLTTKFDDGKNSGLTAYGKAEWNIYRGGRDSAERSKRLIESDLVKKQHAQTKSRVAREVATSYYELAFILESIAIKEKALELNQEQTKLANAKKSAGFTSEADAIEFELREATIKSDIKELQQERANGSRKLSILLGRGETSGDLAVQGHLEQNFKIVPNKEKLLSSLADSNPNLSEAKANLEISRQEKNMIRSGFLPKLDFQAKYGRLANEERVFSENSNYSVGLLLNVPLFSGLSSHYEYKSATSQTIRDELKVTKQNLATKAEAEDLFSQLTTIQERLSLEEKTLSRSEQYYKVTLGEYRRGVKNSPDMVTASERLLNSRIRNLEFRRNYQVTVLKILGLVGAGPNDVF